MAIEVKNLTKSYDKVKVLDNLSFTLEENVIYGLLGRNGAGKTTLLNIINNRIFADKAEMTLNGEKIQENEKALNEMFYVTDDLDLSINSMKINKLFKLVEGFYGGFDWELCSKLVSEFEVNTSKSLVKLSTGYKSIIRIILALCVPCKYIFLDEPVLGLDVNHRELFYKLLLDEYIAKEKTYVISTHLIEEIADLVEKVIVIDKHQIVEAGDVEDIKKGVVTISGPQDSVKAFASNFEILKEAEFGGVYQVMVKRYSALETPSDIVVKPVSMQDYFLYLTQKGVN